MYRNFNIPELNISGDFFHATRKIIDFVYCFNSSTKEKINKAINNIHLPEDYISIHIRRGDKINESGITSLDTYIQKAKEYTNIRCAFISTDDYSVYEELVEQYPEWTFLTNTQINERGNDTDVLKKQSQEIKDEKALCMFISMEIMRKSVFFIGTIRSNIGMFIGMTLPPEKIAYVDSKEWFIW